MFYIPIIGAVALATLTIMEKVVLRKRKINIKLFQTATFLAAVLVMIPLLFFFWLVRLLLNQVYLHISY